MALGETATFTVESKKAVSFQWQWKYDNDAWKNSTNGTNASLDVVATDARFAHNTYRCIVTDAEGHQLITNVVKMIKVEESFQIDKQPENIELALGETATFTVESKKAVSFQWQFAYDGAGWKNSTNGTNASLDVIATDARFAHNTYRCIVTDAEGHQLITNVVKMIKVEEPFQIDKQPENIELALGETATFTVESKKAVSFQWQFAYDGAGWKNSTNGTNASLDVIATDARFAHNTYRCIVTDAEGHQLITNVVKMIRSRSFIVNDVEYYVLDDERTVSVVAYAGTASDVVIPEAVNGYTVVQIGQGAFEGNENLVSIDLPDTITVIGKRAFAGCKKLSSMR